MQPEISRKKIKATNNKKSKEKALVSKKLQIKEKNVHKGKKTTNKNQRKTVDEVEEQNQNLKNVKSMKTKEKA